MKRLIVTADDFGLCSGINRGIAAAFHDGVVTRVSLAPTGEAFIEAVELAHSMPGCGIGVHLALTEEKPLCPPFLIRSLVGHDGVFLKTYGDFCLRYAAGKIDGGEVEREWRAQIDRVLDAGLRPEHLDSHCHIGVLPICFEVMMRLAREYNIPSLRLPVNPLFLDPGGLPRPRLILRSLMFAGVGFWASVLKRRLPSSGVHCADRVAGLRHSGSLDKRKLLGILRRLPEGVTELVCHPGIADSRARERYKHWRYDWEAELRALTDPEVRAFIADRAIQATPRL